MSDELDIIVIGKSLVELSSEESMVKTGYFRKSYGGDTLCAAVTAQRLGAKVGYITKVGNDCFKEYLLDQWASEGLDISQVKLVQNTNGLYLIAVDEYGQPEYSTYLKKSAGESICKEDIQTDYISKAKYFYSSGILQILSLSTKEAARFAYKTAKENNLTTIYKPNYFSGLINVDEARENFNDICEYIDILFLGFQDEGFNLFEIQSINNLIKYLWGLGISTIIAKSYNDSGHYIGAGGNISFVPFFDGTVINPAGSSDAFIGAYMYCLSQGMNHVESAKFAGILEGLHSKKIGAITSIPKKEDVLKIYRGS